MTTRLSTRALLTLGDSAMQLCGTYHIPSDRLAEQDLGASAAGRIGIVFFNSLSAPRAGNGDSAVYWASALAVRGYPCFRFDLPALGDSSGSLPPDFLDFTMDGGYGESLKKAVKELVLRFGLSGVVILGHCAGVITALHAAAEKSQCKGLVLMDPRFFLPLPPRVPHVRFKLAVWSRTTALGKILRAPYNWVRSTPLTVRRDGLPLNTNLSMLKQWKQAASSGMPILMLTSSETNTKAGQFDYTSFAMELAGRKARLCLKLVEGTDHSFANTSGQQTVLAYLQEWMCAYFPLGAGEITQPEPNAADAASATGREALVR